MKKLLIIAVIVVVAMTGCNNKPKPVIINPDLLKYDWESEKDKYDNIFILRIEEDTLMYQTLTFISNGYDLISPYKISYDTLFITSTVNDRYPKITFKYKIIKVDSLKLILKQVFPTSKDTVFFNKQILTKKNDLKIERIEFYSGACFGTCPAQSIIIGSDSIMYHYGYNSYTKHKGLSRYKLSPIEFSRIQSRLNYIDWNNIGMEIPAPSSGYYRLFIKTANDSIEVDGRWSNNEDLNDFLVYLKYLERFLNLTSIENQEVYFRYGRWGELN